MFNRLFLIAAVISSILLISCSSQGSLTKRRYTKGRYLVQVKKPATPKETGKSPQELSALQSPAVTPPVVMSAAPDQPLLPATEPLSTPAQNEITGVATAKHKAGHNFKEVVAKPRKIHHNLASEAKNTEQKSTAPPQGWGWGWGQWGFNDGLIYVVSYLVGFFIGWLIVLLLLEGLVGLWVLGLLLAAVLVIAVFVLLANDE